MNDFAGAHFVHRIEIGVQEADGHRFDRPGLHLARGAAHGLLVQGLQHRTGRIQPFRYAIAPAPGHQRLGLALEHVVQQGANLIADLQHVPEAARGDEPDTGRVALDQGVGGDSGGVNQQPQRLGGESPLGLGTGDGVHKAVGGVGRGGGHLDDRQLAAGLVHQGPVGKNTPDIHAQPVGAHYENSL